MEILMWRRRVGGYPHVTKMSVTFRERARKTDTACQIMFVFMSVQVFTARKRQPVIAVVGCCTSFFLKSFWALCIWLLQLD
jgi:hypothetical protein